MGTDEAFKLPSRVLTNLAKGNRRRGKRLARMVMNTVRNYPELQDQHLYAQGCSNTACLVGWVNVFGLNLTPSVLEEEQLEEAAHEFPEVMGDFEFNDEIAADPEVQAAGWLLGIRDHQALLELQGRVYNQFDSERAIAAFCELTGITDPAKKETASGS